MLMSAWRLQGVLRNQNVNRLRKDLLFDKREPKKMPVVQKSVFHFEVF